MGQEENVDFIFEISDGEISDAPIRASELSQFLALLELFYNATFACLPEADFEVVRASTFDELLEQISFGEYLPASYLNTAIEVDLDFPCLAFSKISYNSPLTLIAKTGSGIAIALTVAAILSGGEVVIADGAYKANLPPLGEGIASLKKAFEQQKSLAPTSTLGPKTN